MVDYNKLTKEELVIVAVTLTNSMHLWIDCFDKLVDELSFLEGIDIDCPEKRIFLKIKEISKKNLINLTKLKPLFTKARERK